MRRRILLIDDEDDIREIVAVSLEAVAEWEVLTASSAAEGIRKAAEHAPDAILLDVMMPEMDGPTALRALQERTETHEIPVIFMTAKVQTREQRALEKLGCRGIIPKPFDPLTLSARISAILGWT